MMKKFILIIIISLATFLRFYDLGNNPPSLYWDEASIGYNAYSILKTGADEYGNFMPLSFRSFDDYKPPLYVYLTVPSIALFGLNEFAIRFPSALFGVLTVFITYFLVREFFQNKNINLKYRKVIIDVPLLSAFLLAISPWHLQFSRPAFEANVGLFFILTGLLFFFKGLKKEKYFVISAVMFVFSLYIYHSFRLITPLLVIISSMLFFSKEVRGRFSIYVFYIILFLSLIPIELSLLAKSGAGSRLSQVTIFNVPNLLHKSIGFIEYDFSRGDLVGSLFHNRRLIYFFEAIKGYIDHFNLNFLFITGDTSKHHHVTGMGTLYLFELPAILVGAYQSLKNIDRRILLLFIMLIIAPLPSAVTTGTPHAVRAIFMLFPLHVFSAFGLIYILKWILTIKNKFRKIPLLFFSLLLAISSIYYYFHQYYIHTPVDYGDFWQYGYKELYQKLNKYENKYDNIIVTFENDHPDIYYLLYNKIDPTFYQGLQKKENIKISRFESKIGKYTFKKIDWWMDKRAPHVLIVADPKELPEDLGDGVVVDEIKLLNGKTAYKLLEIKNVEKAN